MAKDPMHPEEFGGKGMSKLLSPLKRARNLLVVQVGRKLLSFLQKKTLAFESAGALWFEKLWHIGRLEHRKLALAVVLRIALGGAEDKVGHSVARIQEELDRPRC